MKPTVSVIIPTHNSQDLIRICLRAVRKQTYPNIEVVVVDGYSSDGTKAIAKKFGARVIESRAGRSRARNLGAEKAMGDLILFLDSDMELTPRVVRECVGRIEEGFDSVIIPEVSVGVGFWAKCKALEKSCYLGDELIEASRFFKKEVFEAVNGYDPELEAGEDWDLHQRIRKKGYRISRVNSIVLHLEGKLTLAKLMRKKFYYGKTLDVYLKKHPDVAPGQFTLLRNAYLKNTKRIAKYPKLLVGLVFMRACEYIAAFLGLLTAQFRKRRT